MSFLVVHATASVKQALKRASELAQSEERRDDRLAADLSLVDASATGVPLALLRRAVAFCRQRDSDTSRQWLLHVVMRGAALSVPRPAPPAQDPAFVARLERLRNERDAREYRKMVDDVNNRNYETDREASRTALRDTNSQLSLGLNMLVSAVTVFVAIFWYGRQTYGANTHWPWIAGLLGAIGILIVETVLFVIRASRWSA
jgi:hypothetical protein